MLLLLWTYLFCLSFFPPYWCFSLVLILWSFCLLKWEQYVGWIGRYRKSGRNWGWVNIYQIYCTENILNKKAVHCQQSISIQPLARMQAYIKDGYIWSFSHSFTRLYLERKKLHAETGFGFLVTPSYSWKEWGWGFRSPQKYLTIEPRFPRLHLKTAQLLQAQVLSLWFSLKAQTESEDIN